MLAVCCVAWLALGAGGCSRDPDQATVDFSKTLPVAGASQDSLVGSGHTGKWHEVWFFNRKGGPEAAF